MLKLRIVKMMIITASVIFVFAVATNYQFYKQPVGYKLYGINLKDEKQNQPYSVFSIYELYSTRYNQFKNIRISGYRYAGGFSDEPIIGSNSITQSIPKRTPRNLIAAKGGVRFYFYDFIDNKNKWLNFKISFNSENNPLITDVKTFSCTPVEQYVQFTGMSEDEKFILNTLGFTHSLDNGKIDYKFSRNCLSELGNAAIGASYFNDYGIYGAVFLNDKSVALTSLQANRLGKMLPLENILFLVDKKTGEVKHKAAGFYNTNCFFYTMLLPHPDGKSVLFWAYFTESEKQKTELWVASWDTVNDQVRKIAKVENAFDPDRYYTGYLNQYALRPGKNSDILAISITDTISLCLVNIESGAVNTIPVTKEIKSLRWSPDGKYLAILFTDEISILDIDKGTTEKNATNKAYFDIFWGRD